MGEEALVGKEKVDASGICRSQYRDLTQLSSERNYLKGRCQGFCGGLDISRVLYVSEILQNEIYAILYLSVEEQVSAGRNQNCHDYDEHPK